MSSTPRVAQRATDNADWCSNHLFDSIDALEDHLADVLRDLENSTDRVKSITAWDWIINSVSIAN